MRRAKHVVSFIMAVFVLFTSFNFDGITAYASSENELVQINENTEENEVVEETPETSVVSDGENTDITDENVVPDSQGDEVVSTEDEELIVNVEENQEEVLDIQKSGEFEEQTFVILEANGGAFYNGEDTLNIQLNYSTQIFERPTREGYIFTGWYEDADCTKICSRSDDLNKLFVTSPDEYMWNIDFAKLHEKYHNKKLYAGWSSDVYKVTFVYGSDSGNDAEKDNGFVWTRLSNSNRYEKVKAVTKYFKKNEAIDFNSIKTYENSNIINEDPHWSFNNTWYTDYDRSVEYNKYQTNDEDITLYAGFSENRYVLTVHASADEDKSVAYFTSSRSDLDMSNYNDRTYESILIPVAKGQANNIVREIKSIYSDAGAKNVDASLVFDGLYDNPEFEGEPLTDDDIISSDKELWVKWKSGDGHYVTLNPNGGYFLNQAGDKTYKYVAKLSDIGEGDNLFLFGSTNGWCIYNNNLHYDFLGWALSANATKPDYTVHQMNSGDTAGFAFDGKVPEDSTLYAVWKKDVYKLLKLHGNGGKYSFDYFQDSFITDGDVMYYRGTNYSYFTRTFAISREGYTFGGWYIDKELTKPVEFDGLKLDKDLDIYAKWTKNVTVKFDLGSGNPASGQNYTISIAEGDSIESAGKKVPRNPVSADANKSFAGWYKDKAFAQPISAAEISRLRISEDTTFYAKYDKAYTVTFDSGVDGKILDNNSSTYSIKVAEGGKLEGRYPSVDSNNEHKVFQAWYIGGKEVENIANYVITEDTTFTAKYTDCYVVTFHSNMSGVKLDGKSEEITVKVPKGEPLRYAKNDKDKAKVYNAPTIEYKEVANKLPLVKFELAQGTNGYGKYKYTYAYSESSNGSGKKYYLSDKYHVIRSTDSNGKEVDRDIPITGIVPTSDMDLYIVWNDKVTVTFDGNNIAYSKFIATNYYNVVPETVTTSDDFKKLFITIAKGTHFADISNTLSRLTTNREHAHDYVWDWYTDKKLTNLVPFDKKLNENYTCYAKWVNSEYAWVKQDKLFMLHAGDNAVFPPSKYDSRTSVALETAWYSATSPLELPIPVSLDDDKVFNGWYLDEACTKPYTAGTQYYENGYSMVVMPKKVSDLYAGYTTAKHVVLNANGGFFDENEDKTATLNETIKSNEIIHTKEQWAGKGINITNYNVRLRNESSKVFGGWYTDEECTNKATLVSTEAGNEFYVPTAAETTLYAKWIDYSIPSNIKLLSSKDMKVAIGQRAQIRTSLSEDEAQNIHWVIDSVWYTAKNFAPTVKVDNNGVVTGLNAGGAYIHGEINGVCTDTISVTVENKKVATSISLDVDTLNLIKGETATINALITPETAQVQWTSANATIASVEGNGATAVITAGNQPGTTVITAAIGNVKKTITVNVVAPILLNTNKLGITASPNMRGELVATTAHQEGVQWSSSDESIATVEADSEDSAKAVVTPANKFTAEKNVTITASIEIAGKTYTDECQVTLYPIPTIANPYALDAVSKQENPVDVSYGTKVRYAVDTHGADIYYTVSDVENATPADPTAEANKYTGPIVLTSDMANGTDVEKIVIKAIAIKNDNGIEIKSDVVTFSYQMKNADDDWGEVVDADKAQWNNKATNIPDTIWLSDASMNDDEDVDAEGAKTYTGKALTYKDIRVYYGKILLTEKTDYTVKYGNNVNAADASAVKAPVITVTGKGKYTGTFTKTFTINPYELVLRDYSDEAGQYVGNVDLRFKTALKLPSTNKPVSLGVRLYSLKNLSDMYIGDLDKEIAAKNFTVTCTDYGTDTFTANPGKKLMTLTGKGNYTGSFSVSYEVYDSKMALDKTTKLTMKTRMAWAEDGVDPEIVLVDKKDTKKTLELGTDYTVQINYTGNGQHPFGDMDGLVAVYDNANDSIKLTSVGSYQVQILAKGSDYSGFISKTINVTGTDVAFNTFKASVDSLDRRPTEASYTGAAITPVYTIKSGRNAVAADGFYASIQGANVQNNNSVVEVGKYTLVVYGNNDKGYTSKVAKKTFTILGEALSKNKVVTEVAAFDYTGAALSVDELNLTVSNAKGDKQLVEGTDYTAALYDTYKSATNNKSLTANAGVKKLVVIGKGKYTGTIIKDVKVNQINLAKLPVGRNITASAADGAHLKNGFKSDVTVVDNLTGNLELGKDYTVTYANNKAIGVADAGRKAPVATINFKGNYTGKLTANFNITAGTISDAKMTAVDLTAGAFNPSNVKANLVGTDGGKLAAGKDFNLKYYYKAGTAGVKYTRNKVEYTAFGQSVEINKNDILTAGTEILVVAEGINNFANTPENLSKNQLVVRVAAKNHDISKASFKITDQLYTGSEILLSEGDIATHTMNKINLVYGQDYVIDHASYSNNVNVGKKATVTFKGLGEYVGTKTVTFTIKAKSMNYTVVYDKGLGDLVNNKNIPNGIVTMKGKLAKSTYKVAVGYEFAGWSHTPQVSLPSNEAEIGAAYNAIDYRATTSTAQPILDIDTKLYPIGSTVTLYAWYQPKVFTITYKEAKVDTDAPKKYTIATSEYLDEALAYTPVKAGYTFTGWKLNNRKSTDALYATEYNNCKTNPKNVVLTATWVRNK